jgi:hypothetical protein
MEGNNSYGSNIFRRGEIRGREGGDNEEQEGEKKGNLII